MGSESLNYTQFFAEELFKCSLTLCYWKSFAHTQFIQVLQKAKATFSRKESEQDKFFKQATKPYEQQNLFWKIK